MKLALCFIGGVCSGFAIGLIQRALDHVGPWEIAVFLIALFM